MLFDYFKNISFALPEACWLYVLIPLLVTWYVKKQQTRHAAMAVSSLADSGLSSWKSGMRHIPFVLRMLAISCIILALAKPRTENAAQHAEGEGIDIVLCIDVSGSMTAQDFKPNRLEAAKSVAIDFVNQRLTDRIGVVIFSDHNVLIAAIQNIRNGLLEDGTAIGSGLGTSVDRIRNSKSKTRIVVLLTDGENNGGLIDPKTAKEIAKAYAVRVYTIGVGSEGYAPQPVNTPLGVVIQNEKVSIDEKLLKEIANETGGEYFRARDNESLQEIYKNIDGLEKSKMELVRTVRYEDKYFPFVIASLFFVALEVLLNFTLFRRFP